MDSILAFAMANDEIMAKEENRKNDIRDMEAYILQTYGINNQTLIACEELAELIQAISKTVRGGYGTDNLVEEMADSEIMMEQLAIFYGIDRKRIDEVKRHKLERQIKRIEDAKEANTNGDSDRR